MSQQYVQSGISHSPTTHVYDNLGHLTETHYGDGTQEAYIYDKNGNTLTSVDRNFVKSLRAYDSLNRLTTLTYCGPPKTSVSYTYDKDGNLLTLQNQNATITYTYDTRNRVLSEKYDVNLASRTIVDLGCNGSGGISTTSGGTQKSYTVSYSYNGETLDKVTYPTITATNIEVKYTYDGLGRVLSVKNGTGSAYFASSFTYYPNNQLKGLKYGNGLVQNYTYNSMSRLLNVTLVNGGF